MKLDKEFLNKVSPAIWATWNAIAPDACEVVEDNECAMELVLDAGRLEMYGGDAEAARLLNESYKEHDYLKVQKFLCKHIQLY